jgi:hypothetical protein
MSNLLDAKRIETIIVPAIFDASSSTTANFPIGFTPKVIQISQVCNFTAPAVAELVIFRIGGRNIGGSFSNSALSGLSNPVYFKEESSNFWGSQTIQAVSPSGAEVALTGSMVFIITAFS